MKPDWRKRKKRNAIMKRYGFKSFEAYKCYVKYMARVRFILDKDKEITQRHMRNAIAKGGDIVKSSEEWFEESQKLFGAGLDEREANQSKLGFIIRAHLSKMKKQTGAGIAMINKSSIPVVQVESPKFEPKITEYLIDPPATRLRVDDETSEALQLMKELREINEEAESALQNAQGNGA